jgi:hypothetical protein
MVLPRVEEPHLEEFQMDLHQENNLVPQGI